MLRLVVFLALFAGVVYATFWLIEQRNKRRRGGGGAKPVTRGPVGPDDDEDFLRELERRRRHEKRLRETGAADGPGPAKPGHGKPPAPRSGGDPGPGANGGKPGANGGKPGHGRAEGPKDKHSEEPVRDEATTDEET